MNLSCIFIVCEFLSLVFALCLQFSIPTIFCSVCLILTFFFDEFFTFCLMLHFQLNSQIGLDGYYGASFWSILDFLLESCVGSGGI